MNVFHSTMWQMAFISVFIIGGIGKLFFNFHRRIKTLENNINKKL